MSTSLVVFAGGRGTRLGGLNKALVRVGGRPIIERVLEAIGPLTDERLILTNDSSLATVQGVRLVFDAEAHAGVLPALANGLAAATGDVCLSVACDMPFVAPAVFQHMLALQIAEDADVVIPRTSAYLEPMHAVYRREPVLAAILAALERGEQRMISFLPGLRVRELPEHEARALDPTLRTFMNVNTPEELDEAQRLAA